MKNTSRFHFHHTLNDFFPSSAKGATVNYKFNGNPSIKDAIEAIGVPHTEVHIIQANNVFVTFFYNLQDGDEVEVYPYENNNDSLLTTTSPLESIRFIADVHAGRLAKELRMLGLDTLYENHFSDQQIADIADNENRIVLTRDIGLLKQKKIKWGYWLRSQDVNIQLEEVIKRYELQKYIIPFARCIACNGAIEHVDKDQVLRFLPEKTTKYFNEFYQCQNCKRVYWKGSHYEHMLQKLQKLGL